MRNILMMLALCLAAATVRAELKTEEIHYQVGDTELTGYLAYDDAIEGQRPGILVVHEWWGHNAYARKRAEMLAELGYTALAVDMYGSGKVADHPADAKAFMQEAMRDIKVAEARFDAAYKLLAGQDTVNSEQIAAIGYCFGGGVVLHMARIGMDLDGVVSFHGSLGTQQPAETGRVQADVLVFTGAEDAMIPAEQVEAFRQEMDNAGADYEVIVYPGAMHSFTNPQADEFGKRFEMPLAYNAGADQDSWARMQRFFDRIFEPADAE